MSNARTPTAVWLIIFLCYNNKSQLIQSRDHSSVLAWRIPGMVEPGGLPSMGSHRVRHDWSDLAAAAEMLQRPNGRGIEPGNGAELSWRQTVQLMDPHNKITKGTHTHTHTHTQDLPNQTISGTSERLCSASSSWGAQTRARRRVRNRTFILCLPWSFFWNSWGCSRGWSAWELVPLFIGSLCWHGASWTNGCPS